MEALLAIIVANFWQLLIIGALLRHKSMWTYGILMLFFYLFWGYKAWLFWVAFVLIFIADPIDLLSGRMKSKYENRIKELENKLNEVEDRLKDPDYK